MHTSGLNSNTGTEYVFWDSSDNGEWHDSLSNCSLSIIFKWGCKEHLNAITLWHYAIQYTVYTYGNSLNLLKCYII